MDIEDIFRKPGREWSDADKEAVFEWIWRSGYLTELMRFAYGLTSDHALAEDIVEKKLIEIFHKRLHTYDPALYRGKKCPFRNWLAYLIARAAMKAAKQRQRQKEAERTLHKKLAEQQLRCSQPPPSDSAMDKEAFWRRAQPYLDQLSSERYREAIVLFYQQDLSCAEAARMSKYKCSVEAFKVRLCRARQELRIVWQRDEEGGLS